MDANGHSQSRIAEIAILIPRVSSPFRLTPPAPLILTVPGDDSSDQAAQRATMVKHYTVRAELSQTLTPSRQDELTEILAAHQATISPNKDGRTDLKLAVSGHDIWQSILTAMVALTNARWEPIGLHIAQTDIPERSPETERP